MRTIGTLDSEPAASRFSNYLVVKGIENQIESEDNGEHSIWILEDERIGEASTLLQRFRSNPHGSEFSKADSLAVEARQRALKADRQSRSTVTDTARMGYERNFQGMAPVTLALILISVALAIYSRMGEHLRALTPFLISTHETEIPWNLASFREAFADGIFPELRAGQLWRLVTPIFIHFGLMHILFNAMMLRDVGTFLENRFGPRYLLLLVIAIAIPSNFAQALWGGPLFGGLSGVNYGLFGFLWIRGKYDVLAGWELNKNTVYLMLGWFVACLLGIIPHVANTVHAVGLGVGMAWGYYSARR